MSEELLTLDKDDFLRSQKRKGKKEDELRNKSCLLCLIGPKLSSLASSAVSSSSSSVGIGSSFSFCNLLHTYTTYCLIINFYDFCFSPIFDIKTGPIF